MSTTLIINPYANRWQCGHHLNKIQNIIDQKNLNYKIYTTQQKGDALQIAHREFQLGTSNIIAVGGDGTVNEVINGIMHKVTHGQSSKACNIGIIPLGTANDLASQINIPTDINDAIQTITNGYTKTIDIGKVNDRYFINNSAIGLETTVTVTNEKMRFVKGTIRYMLAAILTIIKKPTWNATITWNNQRYTGSLTLVSVGNSNRTGGMFYMTPNALPDDGKLDFIYAPDLSRLHMFKILPLTLTGKHIYEQSIQEHRSKSIEINCTPSSYIQTDGEISECPTNHIKYSILHNAVNIIVPQTTS